MTSRLLVTLISFIIISACARHHDESVDLRCDKGIKQATLLLQKHRAHLEKESISRLQNLITAAKIKQQHGQYAGCNDHAYRAIRLMEPDPKMPK